MNPVEKMYEIATPRAEALIESFRAVGYSLPTAIADIIDNSIAAEASNVWVDFHWSGTESWIAIRDDGRGMSDKELSNAMRPGSRSPLEDREPADLGRFGLGLKTASFSQCRSLSVVSKDFNGVISDRRWDLSYVAEHNEWRLLKDVTPQAEALALAFEAQKSGTLVLWENMDRLVEETSAGDDKAHRNFQSLISETREHLAMIFHRYLSKPKSGLSIWINGTDKQHFVQPWDPFLESHPCTQFTPIDSLPFGKEVVSIRGYVLPHKDKLSEAEYTKAAGPQGWNAQQGFYIYRNDRMLVSGDWLRLGSTGAWAKDEHFKLARLSIDIPNNLDSEWSLDVKKSRATPPARIRDRLRSLAESARADARKIFVHRGEYGPRGSNNNKELERPWSPSTRNGHTVYKIRRSHPLVKGILIADEERKADLETLLRLLEETVPVQQIWLDTAEAKFDHGLPYENLDEQVIIADIHRIWRIMRESGCSVSESKLRLHSMEPYHRYPKIINELN